MLISPHPHACACHAFAIPTFLRDSDEAPAGGKGNAINALGGDVLCAQRRRENPPPDRQF